MAEISDEVKEVFHMALTKLGAPLRSVELTQDMMCDLLNLAVGDYSEKIQNFVINNQWSSLYGKDFSNASDIAYALTVRTLDYSKDFSYWFSKEVGLQQRGNWELKKDFIQLEKGKQCYILPSGREINEVLWVTPSTTKAATFGNIGALDTGIGGGFGQYGNYGGGFGLGGFYVGSAYDTSLLAMDLKYKNQMIRGDLAYKITAGPDGTHILHLLPTPQTMNLAGGIAMDDNWGWNQFAGRFVWYTYYDTTNSDVDDCRKQNKNVVLSPDTVPMDKMQFEYLNEPSKVTVRQLFIAECMTTLALVRGKFDNTVKIPNAELKLNTQDLMTLGKELRDKTMEELTKRLEELSPEKQLEKQKGMTEQLNEILKYKPLGIFMR